MADEQQTDQQPTASSAATEMTDQLRVTNQILRRQSIMLTLVCFVALALMDLSQTQWERNQELYAKIGLLKGLVEAPDLASYYAENQHELHMSLMHEIDFDALVYELEGTDFTDKRPIISAISELKRARRGTWGVTERTISVLGLSIPISTMFFVVPVIILLLVHNFTQLVYYRGRLKRQLGPIEDWREGPYLSGFRQAAARDLGGRYLRLVSGVVVLGFLAFPALVSFLFIMASYNLTSDYDRASTDFVLALSWTCLILIVIHMTIVAYHENICGVRRLMEWASPGRRAADERTVRDRSHSLGKHRKGRSNG